MNFSEMTSLIITIITYITKWNTLFYTIINLLKIISHLVIKGSLVTYYKVLVRTLFPGKFNILSSYLKLHYNYTYTYSINCTESFFSDEQLKPCHSFLIQVYQTFQITFMSRNWDDRQTISDKKNYIKFTLLRKRFPTYVSSIFKVETRC